MAALNSIREFHTELSFVCTSLEALMLLANEEHGELCLAARPALSRFRDLLDAADTLAGAE